MKKACNILIRHNSFSMFRSNNSQQMKFDDQFFCYDEVVDKNHLYLKLERSIDWKVIHSNFAKYYSSTLGRPSIPIKNMVMLLVIKHIETISDEDLVIRLATDLAMQKVLNVTFIDCRLKIKYIKTKRGRTKKVKGYIDPSSLTSFRKRIGIEGVKLIENEVGNFIKKKVRRTQRVVIDTTVAPSDISYPTDIHLLETARKYLIRIIKKYSEKKYRTYLRVARKTFLSYIKLGRKKRIQTKKIQGKMYRFTNRNLKQVKEILTYAQGRMKKKELEIIGNIEKLLQQQNEMLKIIPRSGKKFGIKIQDRIVSIFRGYVRPIPRGKIPQATEFGSKILLELKSGFITLLENNFNNVADNIMAKPYFDRWTGSILGADRGFHSPENTKLSEEFKVKKNFIEKKGKRGHPKSYSLKKIRGQRSILESRIGLSKRKYGLKKVLYSRGPDGEEQWIRLGIMGMNIKYAESI